MDSRVAIITGGARGIGRAVAEKLLKEGCKVALLDVLEEKAIQTEKELQTEYGEGCAIVYKCDVSHSDQLQDTFQKVVDKFGRLDIVINNAGINADSKIDLMLAVHLGGVIHGTMLAIKYMSPPGGKGGVVVNTSSLAGLVPIPYAPVYGGVKHGIVGFTRSIGVSSLKEHKVRVNCVCPGYVDTEISSAKYQTPSRQKEERDELKQQIGVMAAADAADRFYELIQMDSVSGAVMVISKKNNSIIKLPESLEQIKAISDHLKDQHD